MKKLTQMDIDFIGKRCRLIETGHLGTITKTMEWFTPPQYGIQWDKLNAIEIKRIGIPMFWNDINTIELN